MIQHCRFIGTDDKTGGWRRDTSEHYFESGAIALLERHANQNLHFFQRFGESYTRASSRTFSHMHVTMNVLTFKIK
jgi:hypothetical protein